MYYTPETEARCRKMSLKQYIRFKIRILQRDFGIPLTDEQIGHMKACKTEIQADQYARTLLGM